MPRTIWRRYSGRRRALTELAAQYPVSVHAVGLSLGSEIEPAHLERVAALVASLNPPLVSEHLAWSAGDGIYHNDLLPLPYTEESLAVVGGNLGRLQDRLQRQVLVENPAAYLRWPGDSYDEPDFLAALVTRSGCLLLLDLNNVHVSAANHGLDAAAYLAALPGTAIGQYHLAGHCRQGDVLIDSHAGPVAPAVWELYEQALARFGPRPTLVEWDADLPELPVLVGEAVKAAAIMGRHHAIAA